MDEQQDEKADVQELDEKHILAVVSHLRKSSVGMDDGEDGAKLTADRRRSIEYFRGEMTDMNPEGVNRSNATDSLGADVIESLLPDLVEILTDEDAVVFDPVDDEDVEQARIETELVRDVIMVDNDGFLEIYTALKDALQIKTGVWKFWGEEEEETKEQRLAIEDEAAIPIIIERAEAEGWDVDIIGAEAVLSKVVKTTKPKFQAIPPERFGVLDAGPRVKSGDYCVERTTPRLQDIRDKYDDAKLDALDSIDDTSLTATVDDARDTQDDMNESGDLLGDMRRVRLYEHYVRSDFDGEGIKIWAVITDDAETSLLDAYPVERFPYAMITPFVNPHRALGESMMDKCLELQRIRTNLLRQMIDAGNIATNGRVEISDDDSNEDTQDDFLNNDIGGAIRSKTGNAINPLKFGELGFDVLGALEYSAAAGEQRAGVGRQTQGLDSDAMHDTARGQSAMLSRSQRRTRMVARLIAETGFRDLCIGLHAIIRDSGGDSSKRMMGGRFVDIDPQTMGQRSNMRVVISGGSREEASAILKDILGLITTIVEMQGGPSGPVIDLQGVYTVLTRYTDLMPIRGLRDVWMNPEEAEPQQEAPPPPDPQLIKVQGDHQLKQQEMQLKAQMEQQRLEMDRQSKEFEAEMAQRKQQFDQWLALQGQGQTPSGFHPGGALNR